MDAAEFQPHVSSIHDGHDQTQLCFSLESVSQGDDEPAVNSSQDLFLHHRPLQDSIRTSQLPFLSIFYCMRKEKLQLCIRHFLCLIWSVGKFGSTESI